MPYRDGTGPTGQGPKTGRGLGPCGTSGIRKEQTEPSQPTSWLGRLTTGGLGLGQGAGRGRGPGRGLGRGRRGR
jgi:hypothetical protein